MIFVTTGTTKFFFDRMDRIVFTIHQKLPAMPIQYQNLNSQLVSDGRLDVIGELPFNLLLDSINKARVVITHGGPGSISLALQISSHKPIVIPRISLLKEHVSDHQLHFFRYLQEKDVIAPLSARPTHREILQYISSPQKKSQASIDNKSNQQLICHLENIVQSL